MVCLLSEMGAKISRLMYLHASAVSFAAENYFLAPAIEIAHALKESCFMAAGFISCSNNWEESGNSGKCGVEGGVIMLTLWELIACVMASGVILAFKSNREEDGNSGKLVFEGGLMQMRWTIMLMALGFGERLDMVSV